jgi:hypothetical protein
MIGDGRWRATRSSMSIGAFKANALAALLVEHENSAEMGVF